MRAKVKAEDLYEATEIASRIIPSRVAAVEYGMLMITAANGNVSVTANVGDFIQSTIDAEVEEEGTVIVDTKKLLGVLAFHEEGEVASIYKEDNLLIVDYRGKFAIDTGHEEFFLSEPEVDDDVVKLPLNSTDVKSLSRTVELNSVIGTVTSIHVVIREKFVNFVSVSTNKSWITFIRKDHTLDGEASFLIPMLPLLSVGRFLKSDIEIYTETLRTVVKFVHNNVSSILIFSNVNAAPYDISGYLISLPTIATGTVDEDLLLEAVKKIALFTGVIHFSNTEEGLTVLGHNCNLAKMEIPATIDETIELSINASMLKDVLSYAENYTLSLVGVGNLHHALMISSGDTKFYLMEMG